MGTDPNVSESDVRLVGQFGCLKLLPQIFAVNFGIATKLEDDESDCCLCEDEHVVDVVVV
jgi:hypothetical protein